MYKENVGNKLKKARELAGYTQQQVADNTNIKQPQLSKIENGTQEPDMETLGELCDFYVVSADWILGTGIKKENQKK